MDYITHKRCHPSAAASVCLGTRLCFDRVTSRSLSLFQRTLMIWKQPFPSPETTPTMPIKRNKTTPTQWDALKRIQRLNLFEVGGTGYRNSRKSSTTVLVRFIGQLELAMGILYNKSSIVMRYSVDFSTIDVRIVDRRNLETTWRKYHKLPFRCRRHPHNNHIIFPSGNWRKLQHYI